MAAYMKEIQNNELVMRAQLYISKIIIIADQRYIREKEREMMDVCWHLIVSLSLSCHLFLFLRNFWLF